LLGHSVTVDQRIELIMQQLEKMGVNIEEERATADKFDPNYLNKIVD
jgi:serine O-acetyltransferase